MAKGWPIIDKTTETIAEGWELAKEGATKVGEGIGWVARTTHLDDALDFGLRGVGFTLERVVDVLNLVGTGIEKTAKGFFKVTGSAFDYIDEYRHAGRLKDYDKEYTPWDKIPDDQKSHILQKFVDAITAKEEQLLNGSTDQKRIDEIKAGHENVMKAMGALNSIIRVPPPELADLERNRISCNESPDDKKIPNNEHIEALKYDLVSKLKHITGDYNIDLYLHSLDPDLYRMFKEKEVVGEVFGEVREKVKLELAQGTAGKQSDLSCYVPPPPPASEFKEPKSDLGLPKALEGAKNDATNTFNDAFYALGRGNPFRTYDALTLGVVQQALNLGKFAFNLPDYVNKKTYREYGMKEIPAVKEYFSEISGRKDELAKNSDVAGLTRLNEAYERIKGAKEKIDILADEKVPLIKKGQEDRIIEEMKQRDKNPEAGKISQDTYIEQAQKDKSLIEFQKEADKILKHYSQGYEKEFEKLLSSDPKRLSKLMMTEALDEIKRDGIKREGKEIKPEEINGDKIKPEEKGGKKVGMIESNGKTYAAAEADPNNIPAPQNLPAKPQNLTGDFSLSTFTV